MADVYRGTIRLTPDVYAQLEAAGRTGKPLAAIVRDALVEYLARQLWQPQLPQLPPMADDTPTLVAAMTAMAAKLETLEGHVQRLATQMAALTATTAPQPPRRPTAARRQRRQSQPPRLPEQLLQPALRDVPPFDATKFVLGKLCPGRHEYGTSGQTLLRLPSRNCPACVNAFKRAKRAGG